MMQKTQIIVGSFEQVAFPKLHIDDVFAKIDTGAYSGALHCHEIKVVRRQGKRVLRFQPLHGRSAFVEIDDFKSAYVTSSSGHRVKRYIIETDVIILGKRYTMSIGLTNRKDLKSDALIGRRFLRKHGIIVDVRRNAEFDSDGGGNE
ncbi:MAG: RimK/LysX family protein [Candidatus Microsaccharimonas sp.]